MIVCSPPLMDGVCGSPVSWTWRVSMTGRQRPNHVLVTPLPQHAVTKALSVAVLAVSRRCAAMVLRAARHEPPVGVHHPDEPDRMFSHDTGMF